MYRVQRTLGLILILIGQLIVSTPARGAEITGTINYEGGVPKLRPVKMEADPACHAKHAEPVKSEVLVLGEGNTLANVFVYVKSGLPEKKWPVPKEPVVMDQEGCMYKPHVIGIMARQPFKVLNSDGIMHNVHAMPEVNKPFNMAMPPTVKEAVKSFEKIESGFTIKCDVHRWMKAYIHVMDHPYFAVTKKDGKFKISGLPAGTYEIAAWHEHKRLKIDPITVTVAADETKNADFLFKGPEKKKKQ